jgi:hypothetical protein
MALQRLAYELERQGDNERHEREKLTLRLENILLRSERNLLPAPPKSEADVEALLQQIEELKRENEELRKRQRPPKDR